MAHFGHLAEPLLSEGQQRWQSGELTATRPGLARQPRVAGLLLPAPYATVSLPRASHLACFARTLDAQPQLGLWTTYFHYFGQVLPADFLARVFYRMPALKHFLTQADVTQILDEDIDPARPRPKLLTLEVRFKHLVAFLGGSAAAPSSRHN